MVTPPHASRRETLAASKRLLYGGQRYARRHPSVKKNLVLLYYWHLTEGAINLEFSCLLARSQKVGYQAEETGPIGRIGLAEEGAAVLYLPERCKRFPHYLPKSTQPNALGGAAPRARGSENGPLSARCPRISRPIPCTQWTWNLFSSRPTG